MDWAQILVIILSIFLGLLVLSAVVLVVMFIRLTHQIKSVADNTERAMRNIEDAVHSFSKTSSSLAALKMIFKRLKKRKKKQEDV
jgi:cell shape-determining protein MreC